MLLAGYLKCLWWCVTGRFVDYMPLLAGYLKCLALCCRSFRQLHVVTGWLPEVPGCVLQVVPSTLLLLLYWLAT